MSDTQELFACPCCNYLTLPVLGMYEICEVWLQRAGDFSFTALLCYRLFIVCEKLVFASGDAAICLVCA